MKKYLKKTHVNTHNNIHSRFSEMNICLPVCPCSFCTISFVCRFQMYTMWSSEPDTIHYGQKKIKMSFRVLYVFLIMIYLRLISFSQYALFHLLQRSSRRCNISRFYDHCTFSNISLYYNPTASMCCPALLPGCICRLVKIWQTTLEDYHHLSEFSGTVLTRYPKFDCKLRVICDINITSNRK